MDYEKKYKEALERARVWKEKSGMPADKQGILDDIFPELKEPDNGEIRKALLNYMTKMWENSLDDVCGVHVGDVILWLEKQGEQKEYTFKSIPRLLDMIEPTDRAKAYCRKLIDTLVEEGYATDAKIVGDCLKQMNGEKVAMATMDEKQGEQKPAWSEEDEEMRLTVLQDLQNIKESYPNVNVEPEFNWLKSLKTRYTWKPSDEQMADLWNMLCECRPTDHQLLQDIYYGLKKLREE